MDFGIGYRWRSHESNLLLSVKIACRRSGTRRHDVSGEPSAEPPGRQAATFPGAASAGRRRGIPSFWFSR